MEAQGPRREGGAPPPGPQSPQPGPQSPEGPQSPGGPPPAGYGGGPQPQGQPGYGGPPAGGGGGNNLAVAALVVGALGIIFFFLFFPIGIVLAIAAIILGVMGRGAAKRNPAVGRKGMATAGLVLGIVFFVLTLIVIVIAGILLSSLDINLQGIDSPEDINQQEIEEQIQEQLGE